MLLIGNQWGKGWKFALSTLAYGLPLVFIVAPLLSFLPTASFASKGPDHYDLTLLNYRRFFTDAIFIPVLWQTCLLCRGGGGSDHPDSAIRSLSCSPPCRGGGNTLLLMLVLVPLLMSYIIKIYAIRSILGGNGFLNRFLIWSGPNRQPLTIFVFNLNAVLLTLDGAAHSLRDPADFPFARANPARASSKPRSISAPRTGRPSGASSCR